LGYVDFGGTYEDPAVKLDAVIAMGEQDSSDARYRK
jgi:hypothetical protein